MRAYQPDPLADDFQKRLEPLMASSAGYAFAILHHREDAEDAVQEAAIKGFRSFARFDSARSFKSWWLTILRNCCRDLARRRRSRPQTIPMERAGFLLTADPSPDQNQILQAALGQLSEDHREILQLRYFGGCSYHEIAGILNIPEGTVMSRLYAARQALAHVYRED